MNKQEIIEMRGRKLSWDKIAAHYGISRATLRSRLEGVDLGDARMSLLFRADPAAPAEIRRLAAEGYTDEQLAELWGMSLASAQRRRLRAGVRRGPQSGRITAEQAAQMSEMLDEGMSYNAIAEVLGCSTKAVCSRFPGRGWTKEQVCAHASLLRSSERAIKRAWKR